MQVIFVTPHQQPIFIPDEDGTDANATGRGIYHYHMCSSLAAPARFMMYLDQSFYRKRRRKVKRRRKTNSLSCARTDSGEHCFLHVDMSATFCILQAQLLTRSTSSMAAAGAWDWSCSHEVHTAACSWLEALSGPPSASHSKAWSLPL